MQELFYIVNVGGNGTWYRLHFLSTHQCLGGCANYKSLLKTVKRLITKYKKVERLKRVVQKECGVLSEATLKSYKNDYEDYIDCEAELKEVIEKSLERVRDSSPLIRSVKRIKKRQIEKHSEEQVIKEPQQEVAAPKIFRPILLRRKLIH